MKSHEHFPTFKYMAKHVSRALRDPSVRRWGIAGLAVVGIVLAVAWEHLVQYLVSATAHLDRPSYLYLYSVGGFGAALLVAWASRRAVWGCVYAVMLGLVLGGRLFVLHGLLAFGALPSGTLGCQLMGDRGAGLTYFALSVAGGCIGNRLAGVKMPSGIEPLTWRRAFLWAAIVSLVISYWVVLYYVWYHLAHDIPLG